MTRDTWGGTGRVGTALYKEKLLTPGRGAVYVAKGSEVNYPGSAHPGSACYSVVT